MLNVVVLVLSGNPILKLLKGYQGAHDSDSKGYRDSQRGFLILVDGRVEVERRMKEFLLPATGVLVLERRDSISVLTAFSRHLGTNLHVPRCHRLTIK